MPSARRINTALRKVPTWPFYVAGLLLPGWYVYLGATGALGVEPISALEHKLGLLALQVMVAGLMVTPLQRFTGVSLIRFRRMLGLLAFYYVAVHLLTWLVLDIGEPARIWADILKRPFITVGMLSFVLLVPLAVTSNAVSIRRLGALGWRRLHWLVYPAALLGATHFVMVQKTWETEPMVYLLLLAFLIGLRLVPRARPRGVTA